MNLARTKWFIISILLLVYRPVFADQWVIGLDADLSAVAAEGGKAIQLGAQIAIDEINQAGGIKGKTVKLVSKDHRGNPARGADNLHDFSEMPNLLAVLGGVHTPVVLHELPVIHEKKILFLNPWAAGTPIVANGYDPNFVFRLSVRDEFAGGVLVVHAKERGFKKVALLLERTGWGRSNEVSMSKAAQLQGMSVTAVKWFNWKDQLFDQTLEEIKQSGAEAIMLVANAPEGAGVAKAMARRLENDRLPIISHWGVAGGAFVQKAGVKTIANLDIKVLQTFSFLSPWNETIADRVWEGVRARLGDSVTKENISSVVGIAHAYDLIHLLKMAVESAPDTESASIREALINIHAYQGVVKDYLKPFGGDMQEALSASDYQVFGYNKEGHLVPKTE